MMTPEALATRWLALFDTKVTQPRAKKAFMAEHTAIMDELKQLEPEDQQIFNTLINKGVKTILRTAKYE